MEWNNKADSEFKANFAYSQSSELERNRKTVRIESHSWSDIPSSHGNLANEHQNEKEKDAFTSEMIPAAENNEQNARFRARR